MSKVDADEFYKEFLQELNNWSVTVRHKDEDDVWDDMLTKGQCLLAVNATLNKVAPPQEAQE